jgi:hypothetical protein
MNYTIGHNGNVSSTGLFHSAKIPTFLSDRHHQQCQHLHCDAGRPWLLGYLETISRQHITFVKGK